MNQKTTTVPDAMEVQLGMAAWGYDHLVGALYRPGTPAKDRLACYARTYPFVEVDNLRYAWPSDAPLAEWRDQTPEGFRFVPKMHRSLTHGHEPFFGDASDWWSDLAPLHERVPCVLLQFPAAFQNSSSNLEAVIQMMDSIQTPSVVEMRHRSWASTWPDLLAAGAVPCWSLLDGVPIPEHAHPELGYVRLIGDRAIPKHELGGLRRDRLADLEQMNRRVQAQPWRSCQVVITNQLEGSAPLSIERLAKEWGLDVPDRAAAGRHQGQASLFDGL